MAVRTLVRLRGRLALAAGMLLLAALSGASPALAGDGQGAPNVDYRESEQASFAGRTDGLLGRRSPLSPRRIVLDYIREHGIFGLAERDIANLELVARSVSPEGIVHLRFNQVLDGIHSFDSGIDGHVTADGRLINVSGSPEPSARLAEDDPAIGAQRGLREARAAVDGSPRLPEKVRTESEPERVTTFAGGERAVLRWSATAEGPRLVWSVIAEDQDGRFYDVLVDAEDGSLLRRQDLSSHLGEALYFPADPLRTPDQAEITMDPAYYDDHAAGTRLWGQYSRTYIDPQDEDPAPGSEAGGERIQVPASNGAPASPDWLYPQEIVYTHATRCPSTGCTWDRLNPDSKETNQFQAAVNAHVLVSRFHDHLKTAPIGFDEASGNFQRTNTSGEGFGGDYVRTETNDGEGFNNANFSTPPDGIAPRMQMYLYGFSNRLDVNGSDVADIVYHEYTHGLSNRLVVNASGSSALTGFQSRMMGEGWSDFYALDLLVHEGHLTDTAAPGELKKGLYVYPPNGIRNKPIDCPVNPAETVPICNGTPVGAISGGYTYGDINAMYGLLTSPPLAPLYNESPHNGGEVWAQTLWDIRTALGRDTALALITGGMRLSVDGPSMLDMRDAILQQAVAMRSAPGAADDHHDELWEIFRTRGMGADASTRSSGSTILEEGFGLVAPAGPAALTDPYPGGDNDGQIEPGEQFEIRQALRGVTAETVSAISGTLTGGPAGTIVDGAADWPSLAAGEEVSNGDPLIARLPASCSNATRLTISLATSKGPAKVRLGVDSRPGSTQRQTITDATGAVAGVTTSSFEASGSGTISDVNLRIGELVHSRPQDLKVELLHGGASAVIFNGHPWGGQEMVDLIFDSDSSTPFVYALGGGTMSGTRQPAVANALDTFDGLPVAGTWTLRITDSVPGREGELRGWGIVSAPQATCAGKLEIPEAKADAASDVGGDAGTLNGSVNPRGRTTGLRFAFGETREYGRTSEITAAGDGDSFVGASHRLEDLDPGTTYHYRVEAIREGGQVAVVSDDRSFTTASPPDPDPDPGPDPDPDPDPDPEPEPPVISDAAIKLAKAKNGQRRRARIVLTISEPAVVTVTVKGTAPGIRKRQRCIRAPKRKPRKAKSCKRRLPPVTTVAEATAAGKLAIRLSGSGLEKGTYRAILSAVDDGGETSSPATLRFKVTSPARSG